MSRLAITLGPRAPTLPRGRDHDLHDVGVGQDLEVGGVALASMSFRRRGARPSASSSRGWRSCTAPPTDRSFRAQLTEMIGTFTDRRVERYWELLAIMNGWPQRGPSSTPAWEWLLAALRAAG